MGEISDYFSILKNNLKFKEQSHNQIVAFKKLKKFF